MIDLKNEIVLTKEQEAELKAYDEGFDEYLSQQQFEPAEEIHYLRMYIAQDKLDIKFTPEIEKAFDDCSATFHQIQACSIYYGLISRGADHLDLSFVTKELLESLRAGIYPDDEVIAEINNWMNFSDEMQSIDAEMLMNAY